MYTRNAKAQDLEKALKVSLDENQPGTGKGKTNNHRTIDKEEEPEVEVPPTLPNSTVAAATATVITSTRAVTPARKVLPLQRRQMEELRRRELESMRLLHSEQELELTRLQQANKVMFDENSKLKKVLTKNKELKNENDTIKSQMALKKAEYATNKIGWSARFAKQEAETEVKLSRLKTEKSSSSVQIRFLQASLQEKQKEILALQKKSAGFDAMAKKATAFMLKEQEGKKKNEMR